jgi:hypothetical protein
VRFSGRRRPGVPLDDHRGPTPAPVALPTPRSRPDADESSRRREAAGLCQLACRHIAEPVRPDVATCSAELVAGNDRSPTGDDWITDAVIEVAAPASRAPTGFEPAMDQIERTRRWDCWTCARRPATSTTTTVAVAATSASPRTTPALPRSASRSRTATSDQSAMSSPGCGRIVRSRATRIPPASCSIAPPVSPSAAPAASSAGPGGSHALRTRWRRTAAASSLLRDRTLRPRVCSMPWIR